MNLSNKLTFLKAITVLWQKLGHSRLRLEDFYNLFYQLHKFWQRLFLSKVKFLIKIIKAYLLKQMSFPKPFFLFEAIIADLAG